MKPARSRLRRSNQERDGARYVSFKRVFGILEKIARRPATTVQLAVEFGVSERTVLRMMTALDRISIPVYTRHSPSSAEDVWALDVNKFLKRFLPLLGVMLS